MCKNNCECYYNERHIEMGDNRMLLGAMLALCYVSEIGVYDVRRGLSYAISNTESKLG